MNVLDLFSGIGGFALGLERAGFHTSAFCEIEPYCRAVLRKHWPETPIYDDVRALTASTLSRDGIEVDVICGGFPCQPWSLAGQRKGRDDDRDLWPEMLRIIRDCSPRWVIGENVPGLDDKRFMALDGVLSDLENAGYEARPFEIPACAVDAPHKRARLFIVANASSERRQQDAGSASRHEETNEGRGAQGNYIPSGYGEGRSSLANAKHGGRIGQQAGAGGNVADGREAGRQQDACGVGDSGSNALADTERARLEELRGVAGHNGSKCPAAERNGALVNDQGERRSEGRARAEVRGRRDATASTGGAGAWSDYEWLVDPQGKARRVKPGIRLLDVGISRRVDQIRSLGNSVVPQIVTEIGRAIMVAEGLA